MATENKYLRSNRRLWWDHHLGGRAWGLVLYGTLPASLAALGIVKVEPVDVYHAGLLFPFLAVASIPVIVLYLLVRQRLAAWYLLRDGLRTRSVTLTAAILVLSTAVSLAAGVVKGRYVMVPPDRWLTLRPAQLWPPLAEAALIAAIVLVGSTTLFLTAVKETGGLPALPSSEFAKDLQDLRDRLAAILNSDIWTSEAGDVTTVQVALDEAMQLTDRLALRSPSCAGRRDFYRMLKRDLASIEAARSKVETIPLRWSEFFGPAAGTLNEAEAALRTALDDFRRLRVDG